MKTFSIDKDTVYCAALTCALLSLVTKTTFLGIPSIIRQSFLVFSLILLFFNYIYYNTYISIDLKYIFIAAIYLIISFVSFRKSHEIQLLLTPLFILGAKDISLKKILKTFIITNSIILGITVLLFLGGIIPESTAMRNGIIRHSFGFSWPTDLASMLFYLLCADLYLCLKNNRSLISRWIVYLILGYVTFKLSDARLGSTMIFLLLPLSYALKKIDIKKKHVLFYKLMPLSLVICMILSIGIVNYYTNNPLSNISVFLNDLSSNRLYLTDLAVQRFGYTLWGQYNDTGVLRSLLHLQGFYVDSSYYMFFTNYGIILFIIVAIAFYCFNKRLVKNKNYILSIFLALAAIMGIFESHFYFFQYDIFILALFSKINDKNM